LAEHLMKISTFNWWEHCKLVPTSMWTSHITKTFDEWKGESEKVGDETNA
jgi:hypothetical protein